MLNNFFTLFSKDFSIDLGTANTLVYVEGSDHIISEPSVVAINKSNNQVLAIGSEAKAMLGKTPNNIITTRPMRDGVIADFEIVEKMIRYFINRASPNKSLFKPRIAVSIPSSITAVEKRAVQESCEQAGARDILLIEESKSAAIGAALPIEEPAGNMIVDIGGGTTEIAIISLGEIVNEKGIRIGGDKIDEAIQQYIKRNFNLIIGEKTAENIKINFLDFWNYKSTKDVYPIKGRDSFTGLPRSQNITKADIKDAVDETITMIFSEIKNVLDETPPELAADIIERGIVISGGGALMKGFKNLLSHETGLPVIIADNPLTCVVRGASIYLKEWKMFRKSKRIA